MIKDSCQAKIPLISTLALSEPIIFQRREHPHRKILDTLLGKREGPKVIDLVLVSLLSQVNQEYLEVC
jgi:hypothetical protein